MDSLVLAGCVHSSLHGEVKMQVGKEAIQLLVILQKEYQPIVYVEPYITSFKCVRSKRAHLFTFVCLQTLLTCQLDSLSWVKTQAYQNFFSIKDASCWTEWSTSLKSLSGYRGTLFFEKERYTFVYFMISSACLLFAWIRRILVFV